MAIEQISKLRILLNLKLLIEFSKKNVFKH